MRSTRYQLGMGFGIRGGGLVCTNPLVSTEGRKSLYDIGIGRKRFCDGDFVVEGLEDEVVVVEGNRVVGRIVVDFVGMVVGIMVDNMVVAFVAGSFAFVELE